MKYYRNIFSDLKICVTTPTSYASKFTSCMTMIFNFFVVIINDFFTYLASVTRLKFFFFTHDQVFVEMFFHYFFTILILFNNSFNKFISSIFTSENNYWFGKFIINLSKLVSKSTRNMILILFWVRTFIIFNAF